MTIELFDIIQKGLEANNLDTSLIKSTNVNILKFALFCRRVLLKGGEARMLKNLNHYILLQRLTMISNNLYYLAQRYASGNGMAKKEKVINAFIECKNIYETFYKSYYSNELNGLLEMNNIREKCMDSLETEMNKNYGITNVLLYYITECIRIIASSGSLLLYSIEDI